MELVFLGKTNTDGLNSAKLAAYLLFLLKRQSVALIRGAAKITSPPYPSYP